MNSGFLPAATKILRAHATEARREIELARGAGTPDYTALMSFAAHAFALAEKIADHLGNAQLGELPPAECFDSPLEMLEPFEISEPVRDAVAVYSLLERALKTIEHELWSAEATDREGIPPHTNLEVSEECGLIGRVVHWLGGRRALRRIREDRRGLSDRHPPLPPRHPLEALDGFFLHWASPKRTIEVERAKPSKMRTGLLSIEAQEDLDDSFRFRIALCPMRQDLNPVFHISPGGGYFQAPNPDSFHECNSAVELCREVLEAAARQKIDLVVFPELMVCREVQRGIAERLQQGGQHPPLAVAAGSFHVDHATLPLNRCTLLGTDGRSLLSHSKKGQFRVTPKQVRDAPRFFPVIPPTLRDHIYEQIRRDSPIQLLETRIGRIAVAICADCIAPDSIEDFYRELRPDLLIIVAMSNEMELFEGFMRRMADRGTACVLVNAASICPEDQALAMVNFGLHQPSNAPSTFVRWCQGGADPEKWLFRAQDREANLGRGWQTMQEGAESGLGWLESASGERLGLVVDFEPHVAWTAQEFARIAE